MTIDMATIRAKFDGREFIVTDSSSNLKEPPSVDWPLIRYLNILSQTGWKAIRGGFDGWEVILDLERQMETPDKVSTYMMLMFYQLPDPETLLSAAADFQTKLMNELQEVRAKEGWEILAGPKHLSSIKGLWTISIWVNHYLRK